MDKLAINWKIFAQVGLQLKFAFRIRQKIRQIRKLFSIVQNILPENFLFHS